MQRVILAGTIAGCALLALAFAPSRAYAKAAKGPGPIEFVEITNQGLLIGSKKSGVPFTGNVNVSAARGVEFIPFDSKATVQSSGRMLLQKGTVGGDPIDEFFAKDETRRLRIQNGDGGLTELDVIRLVNGFIIARSSQSPESLSRTRSSTYRDDVDATQDTNVTVTLGSEVQGYDVTMVVVLPSLPEGVNAQYVYVTATNRETGEAFDEDYGFFGSGRTQFHHMKLPAGSYSLELSRSFSFGNGIEYDFSTGTSHELPGEIEVTSTNRAFEIEVPDEAPPALDRARITIAGLGRFGPTFANRLQVSLSMYRRDGSGYLVIRRDVGDSDPISIDVNALPGTYSGTLYVAGGNSQDNGSSYTVSFQLDDMPLTLDTEWAVPPLVEITGAILDPNFALYTGDSIGGDAAYQSVAVSIPAQQGIGFYGSAAVTGFARGFRLFVPQGTHGTIQGGFQVKLGGGHPDNSMNRSGRIGLTLTDELRFDESRDVDVSVPEVGRVVTITGTVVNKKGTPIQGSSVVVTRYASGTSFFASAVTDKNGTFRIHVPRGEGYAVSALPPYRPF